MERKRFLAVVMTVMMVISMIHPWFCGQLRQENWAVSLRLRDLQL